MNNQLKSVETFMTTFGQEVKTNIEFPSQKIMDLRVSLIQEELNELQEAIDQRDMVAIADALTDIQYVLSGAYLAFGLQNIADELFNEVQRSNMSKLTKEGTVLYNEAGKVQKSDQYSKPDLRSIVLKANNNEEIVYNEESTTI